MRYDHREKPALAVVLNLLGWLAIFAATGLAVIKGGYYRPPLPAPALSWTRVVLTAAGGILFLTFDGIIRGLYRLQQAFRETLPAPPVTISSAKLKAAQHAKESDLDSLH